MNIDLVLSTVSVGTYYVMQSLCMCVCGGGGGEGRGVCVCNLFGAPAAKWSKRAVTANVRFGEDKEGRKCLRSSYF